MSTFLAEIDWSKVLTEGPGFIAYFGAVLITLISLAAIVAPVWQRAQEARANARLKERMLVHGFSADEIVNVISAGAPTGRRGKVKDFVNYPQPLVG